MMHMHITLIFITMTTVGNEISTLLACLLASKICTYVRTFVVWILYLFISQASKYFSVKQASMHVSSKQVYVSNSIVIEHLTNMEHLYY